jgi:8-oxo-dGTP diphosphatase
MKEIDKIAWIELQNGKILSARSKGKTKFYLPGGKREAGETDEATLIREIMEELNVTILPETIRYVGTFTAQSDGGQEGVMVKMTCYTAGFQGAPMATSEIEEVRWLDTQNMDIISEVDKEIFSYLKEQGQLD